MKLKFHGRSVELIRERGERCVRNEGDLFYRLRNVLRARGFDVIKKPMGKDGHLTDNARPYVRTRHCKGRTSFAIHDDQYAVRNPCTVFNRKGRLSLPMVRHLDKDD